MSSGWKRNDLHGRWVLGGTSWTIGVRIRVMGVDERLLFDVYDGADLVAVRSTLAVAKTYVERRMGRAPAAGGFLVRALIADPRKMQRLAIADHARQQSKRARRS